MNKEEPWISNCQRCKKEINTHKNDQGPMTIEGKEYLLCKDCIFEYIRIKMNAVPPRPKPKRDRTNQEFKKHSPQKSLQKEEPIVIQTEPSEKEAEWQSLMASEKKE